MGRVGVVIAAGGRGLRMGGRVPKQFLRLGRRTILAWSVGAFERIGAVGEIVVVCPEAYRSRVRGMFPRSRHPKVRAVIAGGAGRQDSVRRGLEAFGRVPGLVLVHDAVRPLVGGACILRVIREAARHGAAVVGVPAKDTVKVADARGFFLRTLPREGLWAVQTPQGFRYALLARAHRKALAEGFVGTDEGSLVERLGRRVRIVRGSYGNIKITTAEDLVVARALARRSG